MTRGRRRAGRMRVAFLSVSAEMGGSEVSLLELCAGCGGTAGVAARPGRAARRAAGGGGARSAAPPPTCCRCRRGWRASAKRRAPRAADAGRPRRRAGAGGGQRRLLQPPPGAAAGRARARRRSTPTASSCTCSARGSRRRRRRSSGTCTSTSAAVRSAARSCGAIRVALRAHRRELAERGRGRDGGARRRALPSPASTTRSNPREFAPEGDALDLDALAGLPAAAPGTVRVGLVATFGRWKGHATFLDAIRRVGEPARCRGYIIGGALYDTAGSQYTRAELEGMIAAAGLTGRVGLTGFVESPGRRDARARRRRPREHAAGAVRTGDRRRHGVRPCR